MVYRFRVRETHHIRFLFEHGTFPSRTRARLLRTIAVAFVPTNDSIIGKRHDKAIWVNGRQYKMAAVRKYYM